MTRPWGIVSIVALVLAGIAFFVAGADIQVSDLTAIREIAWGLFCLTVAMLLGYGGWVFRP